MSLTGGLTASLVAGLNGRAMAGVSAAWNPASPAGLIAQLKADAGTFDDSGLTTPAVPSLSGVLMGGWADQSGSGNSGTQTTVGRKPVLYSNVSNTNGLPAPFFDGLENAIAVNGLVSAITANQPFTVFAACATPNDSDGRNIIAFGNSGNNLPVFGFRARVGGVQRVFVRGNDGGTSDVAGAAVTDLLFHVHCLRFDGSTVHLSVDGGAEVSSAISRTATFNTVTVGAWTRTGLIQFFEGSIGEVLFYNRSVTDSERLLTVSYLSRWLNTYPGGTPATPTYFATAPTKYGSNPVLEPLPNSATWDYAKYYFTALRFGATDYRCWYAAASNTGSLWTCYATSADGVTWAKPNLGIFTVDGSTANNVIYNGYGGPIDYDPSAATGLKFLMLTENAGVRLIGSEDGVTGWASKKVIYANASNYPFKEAKCVVRRADGRYLAFYSCRHDVQMRSIAYFLSDTTDPAGDWTDMGVIPDLTATSDAAQFYAITVTKYSDQWLGVVSRYDVNTQINTLDLFASGDEGLTWSLTTANWIPRGAGAAWDSKGLYCGGLMQVGAEWRAYYEGIDTLHDAAYGPGQIGYAAATP